MRFRPRPLVLGGKAERDTWLSAWSGFSVIWMVAIRHKKKPGGGPSAPGAHFGGKNGYIFQMLLNVFESGEFVVQGNFKLQHPFLKKISGLCDFNLCFDFFVSMDCMNSDVEDWQTKKLINPTTLFFSSRNGHYRWTHQPPRSIVRIGKFPAGGKTRDGAFPPRLFDVCPRRRNT